MAEALPPASENRDDEVVDAELVDEAVSEEIDLPTSAAFDMMDPERSRLRRRMAVVSERAFEGQPHIRQLYEDTLAQMLLESEVIPGFGTLQDTALELYAYCWATHKSYAGAADPLPASAYEKLVGRILRAVDVITKVRADASAEEHFKRQFAQKVVESLMRVVDRVVDDKALSNRIQREAITELRKLVESDSARGA